MKTKGILFFLFLSFCGFTQTDVVREADELYNNKRYAAAFAKYSEMIKKDPDNAGINYKIGVCYLNSRSLKNKAAEYFERALEKGPPPMEKLNGKEPEVPFLIYRYLGDAYCINYKFDAAINCYRKYKEYLAYNKLSDPVTSESVERKIEMCRFGKELKELVALPVTLKTENIDKKAKNPKPLFDSSSVLSKDKTARIFTYKVPLNNIRKFDDSKYYEDTDITPGDTAKTNLTTVTVKKTNGREPDTVINVTTIGTSVDGQIVLTYRNDNGDGSLFITSLKNNKWTGISKLDKTVNTMGWEPNETISADGNTLFFSSDRAGGYGGRDIYYCTKQSDGEWSKAVNLGPMVNSPYNDEAPFIHPDGVTLYYSSNRNYPKEYYENFSSTMNSVGNWSKPVVTGYPIDKSNENVFFQVASADDNKKTIKAQTYSPKKLKQLHVDSVRMINEKENYIISFVNSKKIPLTLLKGKVTDKTGSIAGKTEILVTDNETGNSEGIYYTDNKGYYSLILPAGRNNNITFNSPGYLFQSDNVNVNTETDYYKKHRVVTMPLLEKNATVILNNVFFDSAKAVIKMASTLELERVYKLLNDHPEMKIKITNYVQPTDQIPYSKKFAKERAKAVANWFITNGIDKERVKAEGFKRKKLKKKFAKKDQPSEASLNQVELTITEINK